MAKVRSAMLDLFVEPAVISDTEKRGEIIRTVEDLLTTLELNQLSEFTVGESLVKIYSVGDGSITAALKTYPHGLITITFEECMEVSPFTNPKLEELRVQLQRKLKIRVDKIPVVKRGSPVPVYYTTSDERLLEYDFVRTVFEATSKYQNIKIMHSPTLGNCLLLDDLQNLGEMDVSYTHGLMKRGMLSYSGKEILILGGGDGGLLHELLREQPPPKFITMVDIDEMVIEACSKYLRGACGNVLDTLKGKNYEVIVDDCVKKLEEFKASGKKFDYIFNDLTDIPISTTRPQGELWEFVSKILTMSFAVLKDDGHYLNHALGEICVDALRKYEEMLRTFPEKLKFRSHTRYVPSFMENWVFYDIWRDQ